MKYTPYINWSKTEFNTHLKSLANKFDLPVPIKALITAALLDERWDPLQQYDGCTLVQDMYHPCLSCFIHDYLWISGQGGKDSNKVFFYLMLKEGFSESKAKRRYYGVSLYCLFYAKWAHIINKNLNPYSKEFKDVLKYIKK